MSSEGDQDPLTWHEVSPRETLCKHFDLHPGDLPIQGGWGLGRADACIIDRNDPEVSSVLDFDGSKVESLFIEKRIYEDLIISRPVGHGFAGIEWRLIHRDLVRDGEHVYDHIAFAVTAFPERDWDELKSEWEGPNGFSHPEFDSESHQVRRQQCMVRLTSEYWFDITTCETLELFGITFPWVIAGLSRGGLTNHETSTPGLGYSIKYSNSDSTATIYIYDFGIVDIPMDPTDPLVMEQFQRAGDDVRQGGERGLYENLREKRSYATGHPDTGVEFLCAEFEFEQTGEVRDSNVYLTTCGGRFIKVRFTGSASEDSSANARSFADGVGGVLWPGRHRGTSH